MENKEIDGYDYVSQSVNNGYHLYWAAKNSSDKYFTHIVNEKGIPVVNVGTTKIVKMITVDLMMVSRYGRIGLVDVKTGKVLAPCAHDGVHLYGLVDGVMRYCMYNNTPTGKTYSVYQNGKLLAKATYNRSQIRARISKQTTVRIRVESEPDDDESFAITGLVNKNYGINVK